MKNPFWTLLLVGLLACAEEPQPSLNTLPPQAKANKLLVANEGNYSWGNASLSVYLPDSGKVFNEVYQTANSKALGDVLQSITLKGDTAWLVSNNTGELIAIELGTYREIKRIKGFNSPRFMFVYQDSLAFVTDLYADGVQMANLEQGTILKKIAIPTWTEQGIINGSNLLVTSPYTTKLYQIDMENASLAATHEMGDTILSLQEQGQTLLAFGKKGYYELAANYAISKSHNYPAHLRVSQAIMDNSGHLFMRAFNNTLGKTAVHKYDVSADSILATALGFTTAYHFALSPDQQTVYCCDAKDYTSNGEVVVFDNQLREKSRFKVGKIPGHIAFVLE